MTKPSIHKAMVRSKLDPDLAQIVHQLRSLASMPMVMVAGVASSSPVRSLPINFTLKDSGFGRFVDGRVAEQRERRLNEGRDYLAGSQQEDHLLNVYMAWDQDTCEVTATYVCSSASAAIMLKLALA